jgi:hypothetical protein
MAYTTVVTGTTITAAWGNSVRDQLVNPFASAAARASAITVPVEGMLTFLNDTNSPEWYNGSQYVPLIPSSNRVDTQQTTTSTSYTDLATTGPAVTVVTGTSALIIVGGLAVNSGANNSFMGVATSGASTIAAADAQAYDVAGTNNVIASFAYLLTGLTTGSNTFTAKYRVSGGTGTYGNRNLTVLPLP